MLHESEMRIRNFIIFKRAMQCRRFISNASDDGILELERHVPVRKETNFFQKKNNHDLYHF